MGVNRVALLAQRGINDSITTSWELAVSSAKSIWSVAILFSQITVFTGLDSTITTVGSAGGAASVVGSVQRSIVTIFVEIGNSVTANGAGAVTTALRWVNTIGLVITLFGIDGIGDTITTKWQHTVLSTSVWSSVAVVGSVIALFETVSEVDFTVTAFEQAN